MADTEPKVTQVTTGRHFPGEISGEEAKKWA